MRSLKSGQMISSHWEKDNSELLTWPILSLKSNENVKMDLFNKKRYLYCKNIKS